MSELTWPERKGGEREGDVRADRELSFRLGSGLGKNRQAAALTRLQKTYVRKTSEYVVSLLPFPHLSFTLQS